MTQQLEYTPKPGSVPWKVIKFLLENPDEELTRGDIAVKFDTFGGSLDSLLGIAVSREVLRKGRNSDMELVWMLGTNKNVTLGEPTELEIPTLSQALTRPRAAIEPPPPSAGFPEIRKNTPLLDEKSRRRIEFHGWLAQFDVNDSAEFPADFKTEVKRFATEYGKEAGRQFVFAKTRDGAWGMQRTA